MPRSVRSSTAPVSTAAFSVSAMAGIRYFRMLQSSLLSDADTAIDIDAGLLAANHFGLQAQEPDAVLLSIFNRSRVKRGRTALSERYLRRTDTVVRAWGQRCTLHMYAVADWEAAMAATRAKLISATRSSFARRGSDDVEELCERVSAVVKETLLDGREVDTRVVNEILDEYSNIDSATKAQLRRYPFLHATESGLGSRVSRDGKQARLVVITPRTCTWKEGLSVDEATITAAKRYFAAYAPAQEEDFRYWMGIAAAQSRNAVKALVDSGDLVTVNNEADKSLVVMKSVAHKLHLEQEDVPPREEWPVKLLGRFDPYLLPHRKKTDLVSEKFRKRIWQNFAQIIPTVIVHGRIRGCWKLTRTAKAAHVVITLFDDNEGALTERERGACVEAAQEIGTVFWEMDECSVEIVDEGEKNGNRADEDVKEAVVANKNTATVIATAGGKRRSKRQAEAAQKKMKNT